MVSWDDRAFANGLVAGPSATHRGALNPRALGRAAPHAAALNPVSGRLALWALVKALAEVPVCWRPSVFADRDAQRGNCAFEPTAALAPRASTPNRSQERNGRQIRKSTVTLPVPVGTRPTLFAT